MRGDAPATLPPPQGHRHPASRCLAVPRPAGRPGRRGQYCLHVVPRRQPRRPFLGKAGRTAPRAPSPGPLPEARGPSSTVLLAYAADWQVHSQAKPTHGKRARVEGSPAYSDTLREAGEAAAARIDLLVLWWEAIPVILHLRVDLLAVLRYPDFAAAGAAVADDVRHPLAYRPRPNGVYRIRQGAGLVLDPTVDARCMKHLSGAVELFVEGWLSVAGDGLTDLAQRPSRHALDVADFRRSLLRSSRQQATG